MPRGRFMDVGAKRTECLFKVTIIYGSLKSPVQFKSPLIVSPHSSQQQQLCYLPRHLFVYPFIPPYELCRISTSPARTMEAHGLEPTQSGLLSLEGYMEELLLSYVARGEGGAGRLLNLRLVCSTTKGWVDDLPPHHGRRLFANCRARVHLCNNHLMCEEGGLETFLEAPPPSHVTSLLLTGCDRDYNPDRESWNRFVQLWSPRLKSLQLRQLSLPPSIRLQELFSSSSIRRFCCDEISCGGHADTPDFLLQLEELQMNFGRFGQFGQVMDEPQRKWTLRILCSSKRLVIRNWTIYGTHDLKFATDLLRVRILDVDSQLNFSLGTRIMDENELLQNFVAAVVASNSLSSIRVENTTENFLRHIVVLVGEAAAIKFLSCVKSIDGFSGNAEEPILLTNFPTLRRLGCVNIEVWGLIDIPPSVDCLIIWSGLPSQVILSPFLTTLELGKLKCSAAELARSLSFISESCPRLENLDLSWNCWNCDSQEEKEKKEKVGVPQENGLSFQNLKSLIIHMKDNHKVEFLEATQLFLTEGLALPRLSLTSLIVRVAGGRDPPLAPLFDAALLSSLIEGSIGKTLCWVKFEKRWVAEGAEELMVTLEGMAEENSRKRKL